MVLQWDVVASKISEFSRKTDFWSDLQLHKENKMDQERRMHKGKQQMPRLGRDLLGIYHIEYNVIY